MDPKDFNPKKQKNAQSLYTDYTAQRHVDKRATNKSVFPTTNTPELFL